MDSTPSGGIDMGTAIIPYDSCMSVIIIIIIPGDLEAFSHIWSMAYHTTDRN